MVYLIIKYTIGLTGIALLYYLNRYNNNFNQNVVCNIFWIYFKCESTFIKCKNKIISLYKTNPIYSKFDDVFYYKKNQIVSSTMLLHLIMSSNSYSGEYDFVTYEITDDSGKKIYRIFDTQTELINEFCKYRQIEYKQSAVRIISAILVINRNKIDEFYDITPSELHVEYEGNKLYSHKFINYFFDINPDTNYQVKITDSNKNDIVLVNNSQNQQILCIKSNGLEIETIVCNKHVNENLIYRIKNYISGFYTKVKD